MHILVDARMVGDSMHGIAHYVANLIRFLSESGHSVSILIHEPGTKERIESWTGASIHSSYVLNHPFQHPLAPFELFTFLTKLKKQTATKPDLIHFTSYSVPILLKMTGWASKTVITMHDLIQLLPVRDPITGKVSGARFTHKIYFRWIVKPALKSCARVISVSQWTKDSLSMFLGTPNKKIEVIPNGLEKIWFEPGEGEANLLQRLQVNSKFVICVSNAKAHKNVFTLVKACSILWKSGLDFSLVLVIGKTELPSEWEIDSSFKSRIKLLKDINNIQLKTLYSKAVCTVQPSQYEGYSFPVAETLAVGGEVVLSKASAHEEFSNGNQKHLTYYSPFESESALAEKLKHKISGSQTERKNGGVTSSFVISSNELGRRTVKVYQAVLESVGGR